MRDWLFCILELLVYTFGVMGVCALIVEQCHRATYALLGRGVGRFFWYATALPGAPIHELGHALLCLIFGHRIEAFHPLPGAHGAACVEHSYNRRNPWAAMGNVWIAMGPILSGLAVMLLVLYAIFPQALTVYGDAVDALLSGGLSAGSTVALAGDMLRALLTAKSPWWLLVIGWYLLLSMSQHVRLSVADLRSMAPGLPWVVCAAALVATLITLLGESALAATTAALQSYALLQCALFALILLFSLVCLAAAAVWRMVIAIVRL